MANNFTNSLDEKITKLYMEGFHEDSLGLDSPEFGPYDDNSGFMLRRSWFRELRDGVMKYRLTSRQFLGKLQTDFEVTKGKKKV
jgi:hypothetical protein